MFILLRNPAVTDHGAPLLFNVGFLGLILLLAGQSGLTALVGLSDRAITCLTGYLRPQPAPWLEATIRKAFADLDRDLAAILPDQPIAL